MLKRLPPIFVLIALACQELTAGPFQVRLLPGQKDFVFTLYGTPGDLPQVRELVELMRARELGNGFDPGPGPQPGSEPVFEYLAAQHWPSILYSGGEMQIEGGRAVFGSAQSDILAPMKRAGVFHAYQLGEWGYYLHNLSPNERWWRDVYGAEFESFRHLMKPAGLAGYDRRPSTKQECYDRVRSYFVGRQKELLGRIISVTGHSHYEAYAGEWGTECIGLEVAENIAFTQSKFAFARGASRQWDKPWSVQVSPWFSGACTTSGPLRKDSGGARGLDAGHSLSLYERLWLHGWFSGAAMVTPENSIAIFFEKPEAPWTLTSHGLKAVETFRFMKGHDRGVPVTPVAVVLDHLAGYNGYMDKPWGILPPTAGDREIRDLFDSLLFPGSDHIHAKPNPENPESSYLRPTPFGEVFDVVNTAGSGEFLAQYPVLLLAGDIAFDGPFVKSLSEALRRGTRVLMSPQHREALAGDFAPLATLGKVEVLEPWTQPETGRPAAISAKRLGEIIRTELPVEITGKDIQFAVNRNARGWVIELVNNNGVAKTPDAPAVIDPQAIRRVTVKPRFTCERAETWRHPRTYDHPAEIVLELAPGSVEYLELRERI